MGFLKWDTLINAGIEGIDRIWFSLPVNRELNSPVDHFSEVFTAKSKTISYQLTSVGFYDNTFKRYLTIYWYKKQWWLHDSTGSGLAEYMPYELGGVDCSHSIATFSAVGHQPPEEQFKFLKDVLLWEEEEEEEAD